MNSKSQAKSASSTSTSRNSSRRNSGATASTTGPRKSLSRTGSSTSVTQARPPLARASSSTSSLTNRSSLKAECFAGWDSHMYSRKIQVLCQMLPGSEISEEKHRHAHADIRSYRCTVPFGMLVVDQEYRFPYSLGGLTQCGLFDEVLNDLKHGSRCVGAILNMKGGVDESGAKRERVINCIYWGAPKTAERDPIEISQYFGCQTETMSMTREPSKIPSDAVTIRLKLLEGYERDTQFEPLEVAKGKAYLYKAQYRLSVTHKTLGDLAVPLTQRKAILVQALTHCRFNEETRETGALFSGKSNITDGALGLVAWKAGTWLPLTKSRSGF